MRSGCLATHAANASSTAADVAVAAVAFVGFGAGLMLLAALLCVWAPSAALSGLPQVKAYLNGTRVPMLLRASTLVAKAIGITLVVSTAMPLGKEGPMVHIGSIIGSGLSRVTLPFMLPCRPAPAPCCVAAAPPSAAAACLASCTSSSNRAHCTLFSSVSSVERKVAAPAGVVGEIARWIAHGSAAS